MPDSEPPKSNRVTVVVTNDAGKRVTFTVPRGTEPSRLAVEPEPAPGEPLGYAIAEQRPCECGGGCVCGEPGCDRYPPRCEKCDGDGTRTVVTDIEVEREQMYAGPREAEWDTPEDGGWREL